MSVDGILLLNKPLGISSNRALQKAKRLLGVKKAGHTGTLDVMASGMLPIVLGEGCKFSQFLLDADKCYRVKGLLGIKTTTADSEGEVIQETDTSHITEQVLRGAIQSFLGESMQVPSMYSALKHQGVPLYKLAREGVEIERKARKISIAQIDIIDISLPSFECVVTCSKGTYIRNLIEDIGEKLQVGAHVTMLHREYVAPYQDKPMVTLEELEIIADNPPILPIPSMFPHLPSLTLSDDEIKTLYYGQTVERELADSPLWVLYSTQEGLFLGMGEQKSKDTTKPAGLVSLPLLNKTLWWVVVRAALWVVAVSASLYAGLNRFR